MPTSRVGEIEGVHAEDRESERILKDPGIDSRMRLAAIRASAYRDSSDKLCVAETARTNDRRTAVRPRDRESQPLGGISILIVEDEPALLLSVSKLLQHRGFSVIEARDGSSALELIRTRQAHIEAMLLDVTLPGASSREVLEEAERLRPDLVTILTSAYSYESIRASFAGLRAEHFIRKPFGVDDLVRLLQTTLVARSSTVRTESPEIGKARSRGA